MNDDPLLKEQKSASTEGLEYSFVGLPSSTIEIVDVCINLVWIMGNYNKIVKPESIIKNVQDVFTDYDVKSKDKFWKEHCASSLRELVDGHFEVNCKRFLKCVPERNNSEEERKLCESMSNLKEFLNDLTHFKKTAILKAQILLNDPSLNEVTEQSFDKICTDFIYKLELYFKYKKR